MRRRRVVATLVSIILVTALNNPAAAAALVVSQAGHGTATDCDAATPTPYTTIGSAVAAAHPDDLVKICPGVYDEQVAITKPLRLRGENGAVIKPSPMAANTTSLTTRNPGAVVVPVDGTTRVSIEGLTIDGADNSLGCTPSLFGVFYRNASGVVRDNVIKNMQPGLASCSGSGTGVLIQSAQGGTSVV